MSYGYGYGDQNDPYQQMRSPEPFRGLSPRTIAGLFIALVAVVIYMTGSEVNPVTGKRQHIAMSVDEEKAMGLQAAPEMASKMGGAVDPRSDPRAALVARIGRKIVEQSDANRSPYVGNYHFYLLNDSKTVNAFALPGGQVFITRALFDALDDEAELAGVLGHEVGHVVNRHSAEHLAKGRFGQLLTTAFGVGSSGGRDGGRNAMLVASMVNQLSQLKFSRGDESEADEFGMKYMAQAGYDPSAMLDVMNVLKKVSEGGRTPEILATHPMPETRFNEIKETLAREYPGGVPSSFTRGQSLREASRSFGAFGDGSKRGY